MLKNISPLRSKKGFTLVEIIVAVTMFMIVMTIVGVIFTNFFATKRKTEISRMLYEESRTALERIVKEVRRGTIDYEEYWNRFEILSTTETDISVYGQNYGDYALQFYRDHLNPSDPPTSFSRLDENIGKNTDDDPLGDASSLTICDLSHVPSVPDDSGYQQCELYLINAEGTEKTILKLLPEIGADETTIEFRLAMLKLPGRDSNGDNLVDDWNIYGPTSSNPNPEPSPSDFYDFCQAYDASGKCQAFQFQKIQPDSIKITSLKFFISPREDPRKAFAEFSGDVQIQPHVTIQMEAESSLSHSTGIRGEAPTITLQTTVDARAQNEVKSLR